MSGRFEIGRLPNVEEADRLIEDVPRSEMVLDRWGNTADIMEAIMRICDRDELKVQVEEFARKFYAEDEREQLVLLEKLWALIRRKVRYRKDPEPYQYLKHPVRTWKSGLADCKSLTMLYYFCLRALDIPTFGRFVSYGSDRRISHVYNMAILDGRAIPVDLCLDRFGVEERPTKIVDRFTKAYDRPWIRKAAADQRRSAVSGTGSTTPQWVNAGIGGLFIVQGFRSKNLFEKLITFSLGGFYLKEAFIPGRQ